MEAKLNVYEGCESAEPKKTFVCRRLTFDASNAFEEKANEVAKLNDSMAGKSVEEQKEIANKIYDLQAEIIKLFFPTFTREDLGGVDPYEYQNFCLEIGKERNRIVSRTQKN